MKSNQFVIIALISSLIVFFSSCLSNSKDSNSQSLVVYSGVKGGSYNLIIDDILKISSVKLKVEQTGGSMENFEKLLGNQTPSIAILQYDVLLYNDLVSSETVKNLEILLPLAFEEIHLVTLKESTINSIKDLSERKVAIGSLSQGTNITAKFIKRITEINWIDVEVSFKDAFEELLSGKVDAFFFVGAAPVEKLDELSAASKNIIKLVPIENPKLNGVYSSVQIQADKYSWINYNVNTYAVQSVLAVNVANETEASREEVFNLMQDINVNLGKLQQEGHPKWRQIDFYFGDLKWKIHKSAHIFQD